MEGTEATVRDVRSVGDDTVAMAIETPEGFDALPGQFVQLGHTVDGEEIVRHYTISSAAVTDTFEITVGIDPDGTLSPALADLDRGDTVTIDGPFGRVFYEADGPAVVLAGGPGVGPAVGIAEAANDAGHAVAVVYRDDAPAHEDRLETVAAKGGHVWIVDDGIDEAVGEAVAAVDGPVYVYGFSDFCDDAIAALEAAGRDPEAARVERFD
jgi:ferredoxin-NADP reductase